MTDHDITSYAIKQVETTIGELSVRERGIARVAAEAALELKWQVATTTTNTNAQIQTLTAALAEAATNLTQAAETLRRRGLHEHATMYESDAQSARSALTQLFGVAKLEKSFATAKAELVEALDDFEKQMKPLAVAVADAFG